MPALPPAPVAPVVVRPSPTHTLVRRAQGRYRKSRDQAHTGDGSSGSEYRPSGSEDIEDDEDEDADMDKEENDDLLNYEKDKEVREKAIAERIEEYK